MHEKEAQGDHEGTEIYASNFPIIASYCILIKLIMPKHVICHPTPGHVISVDVSNPSISLLFVNFMGIYKCQLLDPTKPLGKLNTIAQIKFSTTDE